MELGRKKPAAHNETCNELILTLAVLAIIQVCGCFRTLRIHADTQPYGYVDLRNVTDVSMRAMVRESLEPCGIHAVDAVQIQGIDSHAVLMCSITGAFTADDLAEETRTSLSEIPGTTQRERTVSKSPRMVKTQIHVTLRNQDERTVYSAGGEFLGDGRKRAVLSALTDALTNLTADCHEPTPR